MILKNNGVINKYNYDTERGKRKLPKLYNEKEECCGCTACKMICPVHAISMKDDEEGFLYPVVNSLICIRCYKCINVCPLKI